MCQFESTAKDMRSLQIIQAVPVLARNLMNKQTKPTNQPKMLQQLSRRPE